MPTRRMAALCDETEPALLALRGLISKRAGATPSPPAPPETVRIVRRLLAEARRVLSRRPLLGGILLPAENPNCDDLFTVLGLASAPLAQYREDYWRDGAGIPARPGGENDGPSLAMVRRPGGNLVRSAR
jgi:hypothetical protein